MRLKCIHCDKPFEVTAERLGGEVNCPHCRQRLRLPSAISATTRQDEDEGSGAWLRSSVSGLVSFVFHVSVFFALSLVTCDYRGGGGLGGEEVAIGELAGPKLDDVAKNDLQAPESTPETQKQDGQDDTFEEVAPPDPTGGGDTVEVQIASLVPSGASGGAPEIGMVSGGGGALGDGMNFMGLSGKGKRFCIIADRSGSMEGPKLEFVKQEILESLGSMRTGTRFQLIFFNQGATPYPQTGWRLPKQERQSVADWMESIRGGGQTNPTPAFELAFKLQPRPDVIFFMTDGLFDPVVVDQVKALNRGGERHVVINTISFVDDSARALLENIARDSGGDYRHVASY